MKWAQVVVGACSSRRWAASAAWPSDRGSGPAAAITALYPELVWFAAHFWSETLFLTLLWWAMERLIAAEARGSARAAAAAAFVGWRS